MEVVTEYVWLSARLFVARVLDGTKLLAMRLSIELIRAAKVLDKAVTAICETERKGE